MLCRNRRNYFGYNLFAKWSTAHVFLESTWESDKVEADA